MNLIGRICIRALFVSLVVVAMAATSGMCQTWLDNTTNKSDDLQTECVRRSDHFRICWGKQPTSSVVIDEDFIQTNLQNLEYDYKKDHSAPPYGFSFRDPCVPSPVDGHSYRANLYINNTHGVDTEGFAFGWTDDRNLSEFSICAEGLNPLDPPSDVHPHEYGHGNIIAAGGINTHSGVWHEPSANWFSCQRDDDYNDVLNQNCSWFPLPHGRDYYDAWPFLEVVREDPNLGPLFISTFFQTGQNDWIFNAMAKQITFTADGYNYMKNVLGSMAGKSITYDFQRGEFFKSHDTNPDPRNHWVYPVHEAGSSTWYRVPWEQAPSQGGYNMIPLTVSAGTTVSCNFRGVCDATRGSDWRVCFVAVDTSGDVRYSNFWNAGSNSITLMPDEGTLYLAVAATPDFYEITFDRDLPFSLIKEPQTYELALTNASIVEPNNGSTSGLVQVANGGGWRASGATVASTAWVGPNARVLGSAKVQGYARVEDFAVVTDSAIVRDNALVSGHALVKGSAQVYGNAKVRDWGVVTDTAQVYDNARVLEHAKVIGTCKAYGNSCARGYAAWYDGGDLSGYAIADGDAADGSVVTNKTSTGWSWGPDQAYNDGLPDTGGLFTQYTFDNANPVYAKDTYGMTWGYLIGRPALVAINDTYRSRVIHLDGATQYIECPRCLNDFKDTTIAVWVYWAGGVNDQKIFSFGDGANKYMYLTPCDTANGKVKFVISNNGTGSEQALIGTAAVTANRWTHVAVSFSGNTGTLYVDGAAVATNAGMTLNPDDLNSPNTLASGNCNYIGRDNSGNCYEGYIDDFRIYSTVQTAVVISTLAAQFTDRNAGVLTTLGDPTTAWYKFDSSSGTTATDSSGSGKNGTVTGGTWTAGKISNCISLNGTSGYVSLPNGLVSGLSSFSITTWVYFNSLPNWERVFDFGSGTATYMFLGVIDGHLRYAIRYNNGSEQIVDSPTALTTGAWHHIAVTQAGGILTIYVDGVSSASGSVSLTPSSLGSTTHTWIGRSQYGADPYLNARIDDFRIYNRALASAEIALFAPTDTSAPTPSPSTWLIAPTAANENTVNMSATRATDPSGVEYYFKCTSGGGHDSGWITSNQYTDNGLTAGTSYTYTVQTRDGNGITGTASAPAGVTTPLDTTAPTTSAPTFASVLGTATNKITVISSKYSDLSQPVQYYFTRVGSSTVSGWQTSPKWVDSVPNNTSTYTYTVRVKDAKGNMSPVSAASSAARGTDQTPPVIPGATYYPITSPWLTRPVIRTNGRLYMTARTATDNSGGTVSYYFHVTNGTTSYDSGWQTNPKWTSTALANGTYTCQLKVRDASANVTPYTGDETVNVTDKNVYRPYTADQLAALPDDNLVDFAGKVTAVASTYYTVTNVGASIKVMPNTTNSATNSGLLNTNVQVKGGMWTYSGLGRTVTFATVTSVTAYTITATAGANGSISPAGSVLVSSGYNQTFTITPNPGYQVASVVVDGVDKGAVSTYMIGYVTANHTISATFSPATYTITASAGTGGTISPSGAVTANYGTNKTLTITPDAGYEIDDVKVDGTSVGAVGSYTFSNLTANHTIQATFKADFVDVANFAALKTKVGQLVRLTGSSTVTFAPIAGTRTTNFFFIGEAKALGCIKVIDNKSCNVAFGGSVVNLIGNVSKTVKGEYVLTLVNSVSSTTGTSIRPVGLSTRSAVTDPNVCTNLVRAWGSVAVTGGRYTLDDGYSSVLSVDPSGLALPANGSTTAVTGILWVNDDGSRVLLQCFAP